MYCSPRAMKVVRSAGISPNYFQKSSHAPWRTTMDENDDIRGIMPILIREICVNLCPIFERAIIKIKGGIDAHFFSSASATNSP